MNKALPYRLPAMLAALCLMLVCLLTVLPTAVSAETTIEEDQQKLSELEAQRKAYTQQLEALQAQISASQNEEKTLLAEKSELEQEITLLDSSIETNEALMEQYQFQIESNEIALVALEDELAEEMEIYGQVLCYYAKYGEASTFEILFSSKSFSDFLTRLDYVGFILEYNNTIVDDITRTTQDIETAKAQNEAYLAECVTLSEELNASRATYDERTAELETAACKCKRYAAQHAGRPRRTQSGGQPHSSVHPAASGTDRQQGELYAQRQRLFLAFCRERHKQPVHIQSVRMAYQPGYKPCGVAQGAGHPCPVRHTDPGGDGWCRD